MESRSELILEGIRGYAVFRLDAEGRIASWPPGARQIFGFSAAESIGQPCNLLYPPEENAAATLQTELSQARSAGSLAEERWLTRQDGSQFWGEGTITALTNPRGEFDGFVKVVRDATTQKLAIEALEHAKTSAEAANAQLVTAVSHDLRTPLTPIAIWTQILEAEEAPDRALLHEGLTVIRQCAEEQHAMIEKFVGQARSGGGVVDASGLRAQE